MMTMSERKTITRSQVCELLKISKSKLFSIINHNRELKFPDPTDGRAMRRQYYEDEVIKFRDAQNYKETVLDRTKNRTIEAKIYAPIKTSTGFDNRAAVAFICAKPTVELSLSSIANKYCRTFGNSVCVHVPERNDRERPHPALAKMSNSA